MNKKEILLQEQILNDEYRALHKLLKLKEKEIDKLAKEKNGQMRSGEWDKEE